MILKANRFCLCRFFFFFIIIILTIIIMIVIRSKKSKLFNKLWFLFFFLFRTFSWQPNRIWWLKGRVVNSKESRETSKPSTEIRTSVLILIYGNCDLLPWFVIILSFAFFNRKVTILSSIAIFHSFFLFSFLAIFHSFIPVF